jgi:TRAP-type C4-dicarboxylate transport system permease small subunit
MARAIDWIDRALRVIAALCLLALTALVAFQVVARYAVGQVPLFAEEIARYAMVWMALMAAAVGVRDAAHIRVEFVPQALRHVSRPLGRALDYLLDTLSLGVFLVLAWYGLDTMLFLATQTSEGMRIPLSLPYAALPLSFLCAALFAAARLITGESGK